MKCPMQQRVVRQTPDDILIDFFECDVACAWYDTKKKQCAILTLAQKDNSKVSIAR